MTSNNLAYAWGDFKEHTVGGYVRATGAGFGVGVVSPRIRPLPENFVRGTTPVTSFAGTGIDKSADYLVGIANYIVTPQEDAFSWEDANKEGLNNMANGSVGSTSTVWADHIRPIQGK
ncbi:hypothetical protein [Rothia sp. P5766]|uniref:hypothetical protein n=1 Tax=Rothia sp. P5766 TaxID=3402656 RepID=UPI003AEAA73D